MAPALETKTPRRHPGSGLVGGDALSPAADAAFGDRLQGIAVSLDKAAENAVREFHAARKDPNLSPPGVVAAQTKAVEAGLRQVAKLIAEPARTVAQRIIKAREELGLTRKLNPSDLQGTGSDNWLSRDLLNRVDMTRRDLFAVEDDGELATVLRSAFGATTDAPDVLTAFAADSLPPHLVRRIEFKAGLNIAELRATLHARLRPTTASALEVWEEVGTQVFFNGGAAGRAITQTTGMNSEGGSDAVEGALRPLKEALAV